MTGRQPRLFPDSIDMERADAKKGGAVNPFKYKGPSVKVGGVRFRAKPKIAYRKRQDPDGSCGCDMCTNILWTPIACLCELPVLNQLKSCCVG